MSMFDKIEIGNEFFKHLQRDDGTRDLIFGEIGEQNHGHAVIDRFGRVEFLRETDGRVVCDNRWQSPLEDPLNNNFGGFNVPPGGGTHPW